MYFYGDSRGVRDSVGLPRDRVSRGVWTVREFVDHCTVLLPGEEGSVDSENGKVEEMIQR